ncbi:permease of the major facilitator superfamily [Aspergillus affinis]|uniref:permease of the major facilitator superfamily n=1 Tax=Aspergillus affinis TaxID=1070780 RepID=UPI0022FE9D43|nr:permease of the major facilitator superfamily [Aspergillus affinis]KAI9044618.1 permease of the major facilitator superfamily [Aspergillus affinis]
MVKDFHVADGENASFYAGILISAFSLAEALTGMIWGGLSDRIGRKPVLLSGCFGTVLSLLIVGLAPNFWVALFGRALGGILNGNIGVIQTMVGELVKRPEHEPRAYAVMPFVWSIGTIMGPETHPDMQPWDLGRDMNDDLAAEHPLLVTAGATANAGADLRVESYGTFNQVRLHQNEDLMVHADGSKSEEAPTKQSIFTWRVTMLIVALAIFTYHSMTFDHLLPIFLQDKRVTEVSTLGTSALSFPGGVGLSTSTVGLIMSTDGIIALFIQSVVFPTLAHYLGVWRLFVVVTILHPLTYFIVPFLIYLPHKILFVGIYTCLALRNVLSIIDYPVLLILIKQASPSDSVLGRLNGLSASAGAASRTIAPPVAGYLYSTGSKVGCTALAWWASTLVAIIGAVQVWFIEQKKYAIATVQPAGRCHYIPNETQPWKETVHIIVTENDPTTRDI